MADELQVLGTLTHVREGWRAQLLDTLRWQCTDRMTGYYLNTLHGEGSLYNYSTALGMPGAVLLRRAAKDLDADWNYTGPVQDEIEA